MQWLLVLLFFCLTILPTRAAEPNAGIVQGLWYDRDSVFVGESVRIYVAIRNNTGADLSGRVEFFANQKSIGRSNVSALNNRIIETWADWTPSYGEHTITATLSRVELSQPGSSTSAVTVTSALAKDTIFVDYDTDGDGIGNRDDPDDDGDGISDEDEIKNGTDPLDPDDPPQPAEQPAGDAANEALLKGEEENPIVDTGSDEPAGLEQFLTPSRANTAFSSVTETINNTKRRLDEYRAARAGEETTGQSVATMETKSEVSAPNSGSNTVATDPNLPEINENGFGTITRTESGGTFGWLKTVFSSIGSIVNWLYGGVLFVLSLYLAHPALVQFTLLLLIIFIIVKTAKRLAGRPIKS